MVVSKRSTRIAARNSRPTSVSNEAHSHKDGTGEEDQESGSTKCGDDGQTSLTSVGEIGKPTESVSGHLSLPSTDSRESSKRRGKKLDADPHRLRSSDLSDNSDQQSIINSKQKEKSALEKVSSFCRRTEKQAPPEELDGSRKRMRSEADVTGGSKRSKLPISDECTSESIIVDAMVIDSEPSSLSSSLYGCLGVKDDSATTRELDIGDEDRGRSLPQHDPSQLCDSNIENGSTQNCPDSNTAMTEMEECSILHASSSVSNKGEPNDEGVARPLTGSDSTMHKGDIHVENVGDDNQSTFRTSMQADITTALLTSTDNVEEHRENAGEIHEPTIARADVSHSISKTCESNETCQNTPRQSELQLDDKIEHDITQNDSVDDGTSRDKPLEIVAFGGHGRAEDDNPIEEITDNIAPIPTQNNTDGLRVRKAHSVSQLKMALFLEASKAHCFGNNAVRMFANYWDTLGKYLTSGPHGSLKRGGPDLRSRTGIESILSGFLKTRKMKLIHNKLILSIMAEAMKTHVPAHYSNHAPRQWKPKTTQSLRAKADEMEMNCNDQSSVQSHWDANFGPYSGTWTACGGEITLSKTDCSSSINPELVGSMRNGNVAVDSIFPSCRLPGALDIDPLVRRLTTHSGVKASDNAVWMIIVAVREYSLSLLKKIIANDKDFGSGHAPQLPNHFHTSLSCQHRSWAKSNLLDGEGRIKDKDSNEGGAESKGKRVINSTSLANVLAERLSAASRLTSMYTTSSLDDRRGTSSLDGIEKVKCLINASIQRSASRRYKSSPEFEAKSSTSTTTDSSARATPVHTNASSNNTTQPDAAKHDAQMIVVPPSTATVVVPPPTTAQAFPTPLLPHLNKPQLLVPPTVAQGPPMYPVMPFQRMQLPNHTAPLMMNHSNHLSIENQVIQSRQLPLPISRPNREPRLKSQEPSPQLITNIMETPQLSSPTTTPTNNPASGRGSTNLAAMISRGENEEGATTEEGKTKEEDITTPPIANNSPTTPQSRGYGAKNLAALKARASSSSSTETGK